MANVLRSPVKSSSLSDLSEQPTRKRKLDPVLEALQNFQADISAQLNDIRSDINTKFDNLSQEMAAYRSANDSKQQELTSQIEELKQENLKRDTTIKHLQDQLEATQRLQRVNHIEIRNIPASEGENVTEIIRKIGAAIKVDYCPNEIKNVYRLNSKIAEKKHLIVEFKSITLKDQFLDSFKKHNLAHKENRLNTGILGAVGDESLYPIRNKDGNVETLINPNTDAALSVDSDSRTNFTYNRYHHLPLETQRQRLPVFQYRNHVLYLLERYQTLVLVGETGCGKSTQVPQYLMEVGHKVCVTQPRVAAALTLASRVAEERGEVVGGQVGYAAGATSARENASIVFMTEGVLIREMFASPLLMQYSCIILDEVHERTQMTDVLMGLLKKIAKKRKNLKLVISSATMDAEFLKDFFNLTDRKATGKTSTSVIMSIQGRTHPIDLFYAQEPVPDYVKATVDTVIKIHENEPFGDILAFLTSQEEISEAVEVLKEYASKNNEQNKYRRTFSSGIQCADMSVLPMFGSLPHYAQIKVFQTADKNVRKVVLATNIAETSVTIPGIVYVIDSGFHKLPYLSSAGVDSLAVTPISKNNAAQRAGRAGRTGRGRCYRLYTEEEYEKLPQSVPPEMCRSDLAAMILLLKALGINNVLRFTFPTPPPAKSLLSGLETLYALGAIDKRGNLTDDVGVRMAELPLKPMLAKILCNSGEYGCIEEALSICAMLHVDGIFSKGGGKHNMAARLSRRNNFEVAEGDIIMYLNIFDSYLRLRDAGDEKRTRKLCKEWCQKMYLNYNVMEKACEIRSSLEKLIKKNFQMENKTFEGLDLGSAKCERVMKCVLSGLFPQAAYLHADGAYRGARAARLHVGLDSCLYRQQQPKWVVFASVQCSGDKTFMRELMVVKKEWLLEVAPHYYKET